MEEEKYQEQGMSLADIWFVIKSNLLVMIAIVIAFTVVGVVYSRMEKPKYKSSASILVDYKDDSGNTGATTEISVSRFLADEYVDMLKDDKILKEAKKISGLQISAATISSNLSIKHNENSIYIQLEYTSFSAEESKHILQSIIKAADKILEEKDPDTGKYVYEKLHGSIQQFGEVSDAVQVSNALVNVFVFMVLGCVVAFFFVFLNESFDKKYKTFEEIEHDLGIPVLAVVPYYDFKAEKKTAMGGDSGEDK